LLDRLRFFAWPSTIAPLERAVFDFRQGRAIVVVKFLEDANNTSMLDEAALGIAGSVGVTAGDNQRDKPP
jgi:hypothetical protein